jgi:hypothetical protein
MRFMVSNLMLQSFIMHMYHNSSFDYVAFTMEFICFGPCLPLTKGYVCFPEFARHVNGFINFVLIEYRFQVLVCFERNTMLCCRVKQETIPSDNIRHVANCNARGDVGS